MILTVAVRGQVPGAWELPVAARYMALTQKVMQAGGCGGLKVLGLGCLDVGRRVWGVDGGARSVCVSRQVCTLPSITCY